MYIYPPLIQVSKIKCLCFTTIYILPPLIQVSNILCVCFTTVWYHKPWPSIRVGSNIISDIHDLPVDLLQKKWNISINTDWSKQNATYCRRDLPLFIRELSLPSLYFPHIQRRITLKHSFYEPIKNNPQF